MPVELIKDDDFFNLCNESADAPENSMVEITGGHVELGKSRDHHLYGWDNEYGKEAVEIRSFKASKYLVSNGEFMAFVEDGGYENEAYWDEEGKKFLLIRDARHPVFWIERHNEKFKYRALTKEIEMPLDWPVDVNYLEAKAFCRWKGKKEGEPDPPKIDFLECRCQLIQCNPPESKIEQQNAKCQKSGDFQNL